MIAMRARSLPAAVLVLFFCLFAVEVECRRARFALQPAEPALTKLSALRPSIERGLLRLCLGLERVSNAVDSTENTVLAPLSIASLLALLLAGANGVTKNELQALFGVENIPHRTEDLHRAFSQLFAELESPNRLKHTIHYASGMFMQTGESISRDFLNLTMGTFKSEVIPVDFRSSSYLSTLLINRWVSNRTNAMIPTLLTDVVSSSTIMMIVNVFYFRGTWEYPFSEKFTKVDKFYVSKNEAIPMPLMVGTMNAHYGKVRGSHEVLGLPYKGGEITMYFVLPEGDLRTYLGTLTPNSVREFVNSTQQRQAVVVIPRMKVDATMELSGPLSSLGVASLFKRTSADLSKISRNLYVSEMIHKVSIEVTETGTVAAAATSSQVLRDGSLPLFRADKPFIFFIYHHGTGTILFWGTVFRPEPLHSQTARKA